MGKFDLTESRITPEQTARASGLRDNVIARSFRGGVYGAGSQLADLGGLVAENLDAPEQATSLRAEAARLQGQAALPQNAPGVSSFKQLREAPSLRNAGEYLGGLVGGSLPYVGAGIAGGLATGGAGAVPAALGAAAALTPFEAGDVAQRQLADPTAMQASSGDRLRDAVVGGGASALAQSIVPAAVAGKVAGRGVKGILAHNAADIPIEGLSEGAGEAIKQVGVSRDKPLDLEAIGENAIGGAAAGGAFAGAGAAADAVRGAAPGAARGVADLAGRAKDRLTPKNVATDAPAAATEPDTAAPKAFGSIWDDLRDLGQKGKTKVDDTVDRVMSGQPLGDLKEFATAQGDRLNEMTAASAAETAKKVQEWGGEMLNDAGLTPERRAAVSEAMQAGNARVVAEMKKAWDKGKAVVGKVDKFYEAFKRRDVDVKATDVSNRIEGPKKSEDYSGAVRAIVADIVPMLQASQPELLENAASINKLADGLRMTLERMQRGPLSAEHRMELIDVLGADTAPVLVKMYEQFGSDTPGDKGRKEDFFKQVEAVQRTQDLYDKVHKALDPEAGINVGQVPRLVDQLQRIALGHADRSPTETKLLNDKFRAEIKRLFGANANQISAAIEKEAGLGNGRGRDDGKVRIDEAGNEVADSEGGFDETGRRVEKPEADVMRYGLSKPDTKGNSRSALNGAAMLEGSRYAVQHLSDLTAKYGKTHDVRFENLPGSDHGHIVVEQRDNPGQFNDADLEGMALDTKKYPNSKSRIEVGDHKIDAIKVARVMGQKEGYSFEGPGKGTAIMRQVDMFKRGIAQLSEQFGQAIDVPDSAVVAFRGDERVTWGEAKRMVDSTAEDRMSKSGQAKLKAMRKAYADPALTEKEKAEIRKEAGALTRFERDRELANDPSTPEENRRVVHNRKQQRAASRGEETTAFEENDPSYDADGNLTAAGVHWLLAGDAHGGIDPNGYRSRIEAKDDGPQRIDPARFDLSTTDPGQGRTAVGKDENIHLAAAATEEKDLINRSNMDGTPHSVSDKRNKDEGEQRNLMSMAIERWADTKSKPAKNVAAHAAVLLKKIHTMSASDRRAFLDLRDGGAGDAAPVVSALRTKYRDAIVAPAVKAPATKKEAPTATTARVNKLLDWFNEPPESYTTEKARGYVKWAKEQVKVVQADLDAETDQNSDNWDRLDDLVSRLKIMLDKAAKVIEGDESLKDVEGSPDPKPLAAKKAALLKAASSSNPDLIAEVKASTDVKALQRAAETLPPGAASEAVNTRIEDLTQTEDAKYSAQTTNPNVNNAASPRQDIKDYINRVLGPSVRTAWAQFSHAGEFARTNTGDVIRLSVHALNPMSVAYHESLHGFFAKLSDMGAKDVAAVLERTAQSAHVLRQMTEFFKNEPAVLAQLRDPEERAAYMYQMWATDPTSMQVGAQAKTVFQRIAQFIRDMLGVWSNDQRALHIMEYFNRGDFVADMHNPNAVRRVLMEPGRNKSLETARELTAPFARLADAVFSTGSARLRETGVPALQDLADLIKRDDTTEGGDQGFIPAARVAATKLRTELATALEPYSPETLDQAMEALQRGVTALAPEARLAQRAIKKFLANTKAYMEKAGVELGDLGPDYFPRVWDVHYISKNQQAFKDMLEPYIRSGEFKGTADGFLRNLMSREGNEFGIETRSPGMQFKKTRELAFLKPADVAEFVTKDLYGTLTSYANQAARKAEWQRRLGEDRLSSLFERAKAEGATDQQIELADEYLRGVDGTLGDTINPHARRIMGNMIVYQNIRLLPLAAFSSIVDPLGVMVRGGTVSDAWTTFKRGVKEIPQSYKKTPAGNDAAADLAELVGVIDSAVLNHTMGDLYTQGMVGGAAKKINSAFFKYNLMEGMNRSFRVGASEAAMRFMLRNANSVEGHSKRWMQELGLRTGDIVQVGDRIAVTEAEGLTAEQVVRVHAAINQWVDGAVLRPDAADKPIWMNDPHWALIAHLKQFVYSFQKVILGRVAHEVTNGNYAPVLALTSYVPVMIAADLVKGIIQGGGDEPEWKKGWTAADYVGRGIERAGLYGVGQFGMDVASDVERGGSGAFALLGPTVEQLGDAVQVLGGSKQFAPVLLRSMPANALYKDSLAKAGEEG